jgi:AraC-like DNA-binding protein
MPGVVEYRSDPSARAQRFWYHVLCIGVSKVQQGLVHSHQAEARFVLHYIRRGEMWHTIGDKTYRVGAGRVCWLNLQQPVRYGNDRPGTAEVWWVLFGGRDLSSLFLDLGADADPVFPLPARARFEKLFQELVRLTRQRPIAYHAQSFGVLALMLAELIAARDPGGDLDLNLVPLAREPARLSDAVRNAIGRIIRFYDEDIGLKYICEATNLSLHYFCRLFHRETGMSPVQYLARYRIEKAKELLVSTSQSIGEIGRMVGMPNQFSFARTFRKIAGKNPTQYRADESAER